MKAENDSQKIFRLLLNCAIASIFLRIVLLKPVNTILLKYNFNSKKGQTHNTGSTESDFFQTRVLD